MATSVSNVKTDHASRYLQQLCKHWSHRFSVEFNATAGRVPFSAESFLDLAAQPGNLIMTLTVEKPEDLERMQNVVVDHLKRFAFREELDVSWAARV
ncbi:MULTISPECIES: DUF2218 domain-containing protein [Rhizobium]|uniref:DUF2218 domain-containing protein n=1 Tax=Rhizobium tropici TaxID=398 RepID=A0A329YHA3_RHITR|nr:MULTISPECIES: DUF2218 domain-containing protein [Rhizobium]MBB3290561.1 hypothetical protein [Rhizobium sp. BK252]MBB3405375.1 hypothetical protein [Rhizobium sp. BK289]MBB3417922.1 hypothetical protein [Rhizobium sp. BK284]MBB3485767.1 hypothetical protein [Rhizobium sp. BK347]MDK4722800.1 DUF2218 domain-containing protein [Rhizobium sp. CNPSo 3968]